MVTETISHEISLPHIICSGFMYVNMIKCKNTKTQKTESLDTWHYAFVKTHRTLQQKD